MPVGDQQLRIAYRFMPRGPYKTDHYRATSVAVHTNAPPAGAFRGFGVPQSAIAQECAYDLLADEIGMDRLAFRRINALKMGCQPLLGKFLKTVLALMIVLPH